MGVNEESLQVIDIEVIIENCPINSIILRYIITRSTYGAGNSHYILHV